MKTTVDLSGATCFELQSQKPDDFFATIALEKPSRCRLISAVRNQNGLKFLSATYSELTDTLQLKVPSQQ